MHTLIDLSCRHLLKKNLICTSASSVAHCKLTTAAMRAHLDVVGKVKEAVGEGGSVEPITDDEIFVFPVSLFDSGLRTTSR